MNAYQEKRSLTIEWRHLEVRGETCDRCAGTYVNIIEAVTSLEMSRQLEGIEAEIIDTVLPKDRIEESNLVLINGVPIEDLLHAGVGYTECPSCTDLAGSPTCCRAVTSEGASAEVLPVEMIRSAILAAVKNSSKDEKRTRA